MDASIAVMQPYFLPYIGYFQLMEASDVFVVYDNVQYSKQSWFNRNRFLFKGAPKYFTIPIENASDYLDVNDRHVSDEINNLKPSIFGQFHQSYGDAPFFNDVFPLFKELIEYKSDNLFDFIFYSIKEVVEYLSIQSKIVVSSNINIDHSKENKYRLWAICKELDYSEYINPPGGKDLYDKADFLSQNIKLHFLEPELKPYPQFDHMFVPGLSIIDVMMFNSPEKVRTKLLTAYQLV